MKQIKKNKVTDGRGQHTKEIAENNREMVRKWFNDYPKSTQKECCKSLGLSVVTVRKHLKDLGYK